MSVPQLPAPTETQWWDDGISGAVFPPRSPLTPQHLVAWSSGGEEALGRPYCTFSTYKVDL